MISFNLSLTNPFSNRWKTIYYIDTLFKNKKSSEIQIVKDNTIIKFSLDYHIRCDHAGIELHLGLFGYSIYISYNDTRHWNHEKNTWCVYGLDGREIT